VSIASDVTFVVICMYLSSHIYLMRKIQCKGKGKMVQNDHDSHGLSWTNAVDLAQNRPLWRLLATSGATHVVVVQAGEEEEERLIYT